MNPQSPSDGTPLNPPRRRGRPPKQSLPNSFPSDRTIREKSRRTGDDPLDFDEEWQTKLSTVIPKGPYQTKSAKWDAYRKILDMQTVREKRGKNRVADWKIAEHIGTTYYEFEREVFSTAFQNYRIAKASMQIMATLADIAPSLRLTLLDLAEELQRDKGHDAKKQREFVALVSNVMEKFGIQKVDISHADSAQELDTEEAIQEGMRIIQDLKGHEDVIQWFTKVATDSGKRERKAIKISGDSGLPEGDPANGPDSTLEAVQLRQASDDKPQDVSIDDRAESTV